MPSQQVIEKLEKLQHELETTTVAVKHIDEAAKVAKNTADILKKIPELLKECRPHLFVVTINGADHEGGWDRLIQPLDQGAFDVAEFLRQLRTINFNGPIGLQHYGVKGDARENLRRSRVAWQRLMTR